MVPIHTSSPEQADSIPETVSAQPSVAAAAEEVAQPPVEPLPSVPGPKYEQVIRLLEQRYIIPGSPGDRIPTERALQIQFGVSRQTVRNALKYLLDRGLIYNQQGSGTYVADRSEGSYIPRVCSYSEDMDRRGMSASTRMIATRWVPASDEVATRLLVPVGSQVLYARRLRLADGQPIGYERVYLVPDAARTVLDIAASQAFAGDIPPREPEPEYTVTRGQMRIQAGLFSEQDSIDFNGLPKIGAATLQVALTGYTAEGDPVEHSVTLYESAAYFYEMIL